VKNSQLTEIVVREQSRLRNFIRRRVPDRLDAEDILQDVFSRLVEANALLMPIEHVTGWLFRVARNRITDFFRAKRPQPVRDRLSDGDDVALEEWLPSPEAGPDALFMRTAVLDALASALAELPRDQRDVFIAHELDGRSFKEISAATGVGVNTLLSRKHYAVLHLRRRLQRIHDELTDERGRT
jgi:RNA polymerase sigma factor (sigma-70 family)